MNELTHEKYANALRRIADWIEVHPELDLPSERCLSFYTPVTKDDLAKYARAFGDCKKLLSEDFARVSKDFGGVRLEAIVYRSEVCERVVVGKKVIPETIIPAILVPEHEEDIIEWKCPESILSE